MTELTPNSPAADLKCFRGWTRFIRLTIVMSMVTAMASTLGCRICADEDLLAYPTYGGAWQRTLRESGRVGSVFDPGGSRMADLDARTDPEQADAVMRDNVDSDEADRSDAQRAERDRQQQDLDDQLRDSEETESDAEQQRRLDEMERRFEGMRLEDIKKLVVPPSGDWQ